MGTVACSQTGIFEDVPTQAQHHADLRAREEDLTPRGVVRAVLQAWARSVNHDARGLRVLDVCASYGVWSSELRRLAHRLRLPVNITAVELDERKAPHLRKWADRVLTGVDWTFALDPHLEPHDNEYDLAIGNPHFSALTNDDPHESMPALLLEHARSVLLFHQEQNFQKSIAGCRIWHEYQPRRVFHIPGSIRFRVGTNPNTGKPYGADSRCYQATYWNGPASGVTESVMMPWLEAPARRWSRMPGTEEPSSELPAAPGWEERR